MQTFLEFLWGCVGQGILDIIVWSCWPFMLAGLMYWVLGSICHGPIFMAGPVAINVPGAFGALVVVSIYVCWKCSSSDSSE